MRVRLERQLGYLSGPLDHSGEAGRSKWSTPLGREHEGRLRLLLTMQPPEGAQFVAEDRMRAGRALLDPADVQGGRSEVNLSPRAFKVLLIDNERLFWHWSDARSTLLVQARACSTRYQTPLNDTPPKAVSRPWGIHMSSPTVTRSCGSEPEN